MPSVIPRRPDGVGPWRCTVGGGIGHFGRSFITSHHRGAIRIHPPCIPTRGGATRAIVNTSVVSENGPAHLTWAAPRDARYGIAIPSCPLHSAVRSGTGEIFHSFPGFFAHGQPVRVRPSAKRGLAVPRLQHMRDLLHRLRPPRPPRPPRPLRPLRPLHPVRPVRPQPPSDASTSVVTEVRPRPKATSGRSDGGAAPGLSGVQGTDFDKKDEGQRGSARLRQARLGDSIVLRPPIRG